jgi:hypothetical protein
MLTIACFKSGIVFFAELDKQFFGTFFMGITLLNIFFTLMSSVTLFFLIFLLDSDASGSQALLSIKRAVKMVFYNFPFALISMNVVVLLYAVISGIVALSVFVVGGYLSAACQGLIIDLMLNSLGILFALLLACFFVNYYIKKIHDNYSLYVGN